MKFKQGNIIVSQQDVDREIVKVCKDYYLWKYPNLKYGVFNTKNSNDPLLEWWELKTNCSLYTPISETSERCNICGKLKWEHNNQ